MQTNAFTICIVLSADIGHTLPEVFMPHSFSQRIAPYVKAELANAALARLAGDTRQEFAYLERAHVLGQAATYWHVKVHMLMLLWAYRNRSVKEALGQVLRIFGAAGKTAFGLVPQGNTGGVNVSPFKSLPVAPELAALIQQARSGL
jgi:hypothetical protein